MSRARLLPPFVLLASLLAGCDQLGLESATQVAEKRAAEGKAVGGACRHAGRAIEDCYTLNKRVDKSAIYAGWREMDDYMRENKLLPVPPQLTPDAKTRTADAAAEPGDEASKPEKAEKSEKSEKSEKPAKGRKVADAGASH